jgi:hypothetical protein
MALELLNDGLWSTWKGKIDNRELRMGLLFRVVTQCIADRPICCGD